MRTVADALLWLLAGVLIVAGGLCVRLSIVGGHSMEPTLVPGDLCVAIGRADIAIGDIVLYRGPGAGTVLHRVVGIGSRGELRTQGDANPIEDRDQVAVSQVQGRVVTIVPFGRAVRGWMRAVRGATLLTQSR